MPSARRTSLLRGKKKDARGEMDAAVVGGEEGVPGREAVADVEDNKGASGKKAVVKDVEKGRSAGKGPRLWRMRGLKRLFLLRKKPPL